jgi:hypothetical protein
VHEALVAAEPALREIGGALGAEREVVILAGNHDHHLVAPWFDRRFRLVVDPAPLGLESAVEFEPSDALAALAGMLEPAATRAVYPGVWLRSDVYATHGHYLDRHTTVPAFERIAAGAMARIVREPPTGPRRAEDYEAVLSPMYAWIHAIAQTGLRDMEETAHGPSTRAREVLTGNGKRSIRRLGLLAAFPALLAGLNRARLGPLRSDLSGPELRRAALRAFGEVVGRLEVDASHVIFGHTHRAGPLPQDERSEWRALRGAAVLNTGSWIHEPTWIGADPKRSPYRPGFAAVVGEEGPPELINLLD